jgi:hypothetical protein
VSEEESKPSAPPEVVSFTAFVLSLSTAALQNLGVSLTEDDQEEACVNLALAKQTIDVLEMLESKTQGNLSDEESKLLANILYDLRMRYVKTAQETSCTE